ncbi:recombinase family protein [Paracoccus marinus]|uniref:recombinase family protein n=1 Tax=Paracoccus marinus TaxID=288426 RepID=UPI00235C49EE|nr:hypothetical protein GCM10007893_03420 [Paracoccus marinus]
MRRIFEDYPKGTSPQKIAGPNGGHWGTSTILGNRERGTGILNNELYVGRRVWNRLRYVKDPGTGKRISRLNSENDWVITDVPRLRIVDDTLWEPRGNPQAGRGA